MKLLAVLSIFLAFSAAAQECNLEGMKWMGIPFDRQEKFHPECKPQVLYSWISSPDIIKTNDPLQPFKKRALFMFRTPLGTSFYGKFSYRVKLKPDVRYKLVPWDETHYNCLHPEHEKKNTVFVNQDPNGFSEYVLCSSGPVESWSFGMDEHMQEMERELDLIITKGAKNVDGFLNPNSKKYGCKSCFQGYTIHDARNDGSRETIEASIALMDQWVKAGKGRVYNLSTRKAHTNGPEVDRHFQTNLPLPFHRSYRGR